MRRKRTIALLILCGLIAPNGASGTVVLPTDLDGASHEQAIRELIDRGIVEGYGDGTFRPNAPINRAELLKILIGTRFPNHKASDLRCFTDLETKTPQWYAAAVCAGRELGIVRGYGDGTFKPEQIVTLAEALKMSLLSFGILPRSQSGGEWYERYLLEARDLDILPSLLKTPHHPLSRGEMAEMTFALLQAEEKHSMTMNNALCGNAVKEGAEQCDDGNTEDSDGCSSICIVVPEPVRRAILQLDAQATGTVTSIAQGQRHVALMKFTVTAGRQDALLTSLTFAPTVGSLLFAKHYTLAMDRDGTGTYGTVVQADGKTDDPHLIFDLGSTGFKPVSKNTAKMAVLLPKGLSIPFIVTADLVSTLGPVSLGIQFATDLEDFVTAEGATDGLPLTGIETNNACPSDNCFIRVNTQTSANIDVAERGSLFLTQDSTPAPSHILIGGTITPPLLRIKLHATGEPVDLHELRIDGVSSSIDSLLLYRLSLGETLNQNALPFAQATSGQCSSQPATRVCAILPLGAMILQPNQDTIITIAARMKSDQLGGVSGENLTLSLASDGSDAGRAIIARGIFSNQEIAQNNGDPANTGEVFIGTAVPAATMQILGRTFDTALASISAVANAGAATSMNIPSGNAVIGAFRIDAWPHTNGKNGLNDVVLKTLSFSVNAQNVQLDPAGYRLVTSADENAELLCSANGTTGDITVTCASIENGNIQKRIGQGQWVIYKLKANVTNTSIAAGTSTLSVELPMLGNRAQTNSILWSDEITDFTWVDVPLSSVQSTVYRTR